MFPHLFWLLFLSPFLVRAHHQNRPSFGAPNLTISACTGLPYLGTAFWCVVMKKQFVAVMQNDGFVLARPVYTQCRRFSVKGVLGIDLDSVSPSLGRAK